MSDLAYLLQNGGMQSETGNKLVRHRLAVCFTARIVLVEGQKKCRHVLDTNR